MTEPSDFVEFDRMVDSLYYSSRKIPERCENSFVNYRIKCTLRIYYQKLC